MEAEAKKRLISCYGKTRQGVIEKEKFVMPTLSSTTFTNASAKVTPPTSEISSGATIEQVENLLAERDVRLVNLLSVKVLAVAGKLPEIIDDTSTVSTVIVNYE